MLVDFNVGSFFFQSNKLAGRQSCYIFTRHKGCTKSRVTISVAITTAGNLANYFNKNRVVQATNLYAFVLENVTSYVLATVNMNILVVFGHVEISGMLLPESYFLLSPKRRYCPPKYNSMFQKTVIFQTDKQLGGIYFEKTTILFQLIMAY